MAALFVWVLTIVLWSAGDSQPAVQAIPELTQVACERDMTKFLNDEAVENADAPYPLRDRFDVRCDLRIAGSENA